DQAGVVGREHVVAEAHAVERAGLEVLDDDVALPRQGAQNVLRPLVLEIEGDALLVAVGAEIVGAFSAHPGRSPAPRIVADAGLLDLDDLSAEVAEHHGAIWPGQDSRQVEHADAVERPAHSYLSIRSVSVAGSLPVR